MGLFLMFIGHEVADKPEEFLAYIDADFRQHILILGPCRHEGKPKREPYEALIRAIAYQQLHSKAGDAILARLMAVHPTQPFPSPKQLLATPFEQLRSCGFSAAKIATIRLVAQAALDGQVPTLEEAMHLSDDELINRLTALRGIGRWTVEMLMIYSFERTDILPADDFGIREGYRRLKKLEKAPTAGQIRIISQAWSPYRTTAAWYLWRVPK
jgi:DNA-3-methyladenine glycosylase II